MRTLLFLLLSVFAFGQTRDSLVYTPVTVQVTHDTTFTVTVTQGITHDSSYVRVDTIKIPIPVPTVLKGMYLHPDMVTIGNSTSENSYLTWCKREGVNMLNCYARAYTYTETKRTQLAAFVKKAKENYGIYEVSIDVRLTDNRELPGIKAYFAKYAGTVSMINLLAEYEPYTLNSTGQYDDLYLPTYTAKYNHFFYILKTIGPLCDQYNTSFDWYEGWIGNNYSNPQAANDSLVKYCDRVFLSNYVTTSDYYSTNTGLGKWDNRMDKRCDKIAIGCRNMGKPFMPILEIQSLETNFLRTVYACPATSVNKCHSFYGSTYQDAINAYQLSTPLILQYTRLIGKTIFLDKTAKICHP